MSDDRRDDPDQLEDALDSWLLAYEEWRATTGASGAKLAPDAVPAPLRSRMLEVARCIEMLDRTLGADHSSNARPRDHERWEIVGPSSSTPAILQAQLLLDLAAPVQSSVRARLGKFEIVRELGRGGFSIVYLAVDTVMKRQVALKVPLPALLLTPDLRMRWLREAQAAASLAHPNIVRAYEAGEIGPVCYIASAYCSGATLSAWLREQSAPVSPATAARVVLALAAATEHAHQRGILHRDIKPSNVLLEPAASDSAGPESIQESVRAALEFVPKLADFGLAKLLEPAGNADATRTGLVLGTPAYMAPEQAAGRLDKISPATDVYALGAILYELLTGRAPLDVGPERKAALSAEPNAPEPPRRIRPDLPVELECITLKCLAREPVERYATAQALLDDLDRFLTHRPIVARPASTWTRTCRAIRGQPVATSLIVTIAFVLISSIGAVVWVNAAKRATREAIERGDGLQQQRDLAAELLTFAQRRHRYASQIKLAQQAWDAGRIDQALSGLESSLSSAGEADPRGFEWHFLWSLLHRERSTLPMWLLSVDTIGIYTRWQVL